MNTRLSSVAAGSIERLETAEATMEDGSIRCHWGFHRGKTSHRRIDHIMTYSNCLTYS